MIEGLLKQIADTFKSKGYHVLFYRSVGTNSVYIKLDYGVAHTITLRDHVGKAKYSYKHNVFVNKTEYYEKDGRYYYSPNDLDKLVKNIDNHKIDLINKYGESKYREFMDRNKSKGEQERGFWQYCKEW